MPLLKFTLSEEGVGALRDALACLNKFGEEVSLEATNEKLIFTAMNSSKSAYAKFGFATDRFFSKYHYEGTAENRNKFYCKLYNRALLSIFRARSGDPLHEHEKDTTIERCEVAVEDEPGRNSRFIVKMVCRNGMITKYQLPFEVSPPVHARFNKEEMTNQWIMSSRRLRPLMDDFGPGIEYLDIHADDDQTVIFTCYTEKVVHGDEVLKKPLHTSIAVERDEFDVFEVSDDRIHVVISVKDFRAITQHAALFNGEITADYSIPSRPMQLSYDADGIKCEYLLMTIGDRGVSGPKAKQGKTATRGSKPAQLEAAASRATSHAPTPVPQQASARQEQPMPALRPSNPRLSQRPPPPPPPVFGDDESLFVNEDQQWEPVSHEDEDEQEDVDQSRLEWNPSAQPNPSSTDIRSAMSRQATSNNNSMVENPNEEPAASGYEPTQRLSDVRKFGLFGE